MGKKIALRAPFWFVLLAAVYFPEVTCCLTGSQESGSMPPKCCALLEELMGAQSSEKEACFVQQGGCQSRTNQLSYLPIQNSFIPS